MKWNEKYDLIVIIFFTNEDLKMFSDIMSIQLLKHFVQTFPFGDSFSLQISAYGEWQRDLVTSRDKSTGKTCLQH